MTKPTRFRKKNRIYTHWDKNVTEVRILHQPKLEKKAEPVSAIPIEADQKSAKGNYSNLVIVNFNLDNFVVDFVSLSTDKLKGKVVSRIIASPRRAKQLQATIEESIKNYEARFGTIK